METAQDTFILAVPGSDQTRELSREGLLRELVMGQITADYWVWSPEDADWKQISQLPALRNPPPQPVAPPAPAAAPKFTVNPAPIPKLTVNPEPVPAVSPEPKFTVNPAPIPKLAVSAAPIQKVTVNPAPMAAASVTAVPTPKLPSTPAAKATGIAPAETAADPPALLLTPKASAPAQAFKPIPALAATPAPKAAAAPMVKENPAFVPAKVQPIAKTVVHAPPPAPVKQKRVVKPRNVKVEEDDGFPYVKILFGVLYVAVAAIIAGNYLLVDKTLDDTLAHTPFVLVPTHAHLGSFVQPNALVIHILPNSELTERNFADYLQTLAKSTPNQPFNKDEPFGTVALTSAWFSQYALTGEDWHSLGKMTDAKTQEREDFIADHLCTVAGQPLIRHTATLGGANLTAARAQVWNDLTAHFVSHG